MAKFEDGNPGGPGRVRGSRNKASLMREAISQADGIGILHALVKKARKGDVAAARLILSYICPPGTFAKISLPPINDGAGIAKGQACIIDAASNEEISLEQAGQYSALLENRRRALETVDIERNLQEAQDNLAEREKAGSKGRS